MTTEADSGRSERQRARLVENCRQAAAAESPRERAQEWRERDEATRSRIFASLMRMSDAVARSRPEPYVKPPLAFPKFASRRHDA